MDPSRPSEPFDQLRDFLKSMFQFGDNDLDFGIYRITRLKRHFIEAFIDGGDATSLRATVTRVLASVHDQQAEVARNSLAAFAATLGEKGKASWVALEARPGDGKAQAAFKKLLALADDEERRQAEAQFDAWLESSKRADDALETKIYNHLLNFFDLYYADGDFGYNTRATSAFMVPYEADYDGSDTFFHWKHKDSYYIKTGNGFHGVRFEVEGKWLEFRLVGGGGEEAESTARNNDKDDERKHYRLAGIEQVETIGAAGTPRKLWQVRFMLASESTAKTDIYPALWRAAFDDRDLTAYLYKKPGKDDAPPGKPAFNDLGKDYDKAEGGHVKGVGQLRLKFDKYVEGLVAREEFKTLGGNAGERQEALQDDPVAKALWQIDRNLNKFYVGNDADYFVHKDLQGFLTREKTRFIKSVVFSDLPALLHAGEDNQTVLVARAFNDVADTLIGFLAAIENFQKALFELKKKVVDTHYLVSVGKIPPAFHARVFACKAQRDEWQDLYKVNISSAAQLADHGTLVVDTSLYRATDPEFQDDLLGLSEFDQLDEQTDGLLINSENWQALNLLQETFRDRIKCIYIDPPYNTGSDGFLYKDSFRHSSWASMIHDRLVLAYPLLGKSGVLFASIDDKERTQLEMQLKQVFGVGNRVEELIWAQNSTKNQSPTYSTNHEYVEVFARDLEAAKADPAMFREPKPGYAEMMELVERLNPQYPKVVEVEAEIGKLFEQHREELRADLEERGIEFDKNLDLWKGLYNYKRAEYRDEHGKFVKEDDARARQARIWIWRESDSSFPLGGGTANKAGVYEPNDKDYRFYEPIHPDTGKPCKPPKRGWVWPRDKVEGLASSFNEMESDKRIAWGPDESKVPQAKRFLNEVLTNVARSVVVDYTDGEKELAKLFGRNWVFSNPKPTTLIERFAQQTTGPGEWLLDFFAGSGTSGHAVLRSDEQRRFLLTEMGGYFDSILVPRIKRVMYSTQWKDGAPVSVGHARHLVRVQAFEQYEDTLDNLQPAWDQAKLPANVPVRYLFRPEENALFCSLDLSRPFAQTLRIGKARTETSIDLAETWCYLQGYWVRSRHMYRKDFDRPYLAVETTHGVLNVWRDIAVGEDDTDNVKAILARYVDDDGASRIERLEVNLDADKRRLDIETVLISADDFMRGAAWS